MVWVSKIRCVQGRAGGLLLLALVQLPIIRECGACEQCVIYLCSLSDVSVIVCTDMENVYHRTNGRIKYSDCVS